MKFANTLISIMVIASQSYAGFPGFNRGRPGLPVVAIQTADVKLYGTDLALFENANTGTVTVDQANNTMKLELFDDLCNTMFPTGEISCRAMPVLVATYEVSVESTQVGSCGEIIYKGSVSMQPIDGPQFKLTVSDNREFSNHCASIREVLPTTGNLEVAAGRGIPAKALSFEGNLLK